jgi:4-amino-4-deoxy-L-arabinose transferase-like glycosyltransferase
MDVDRTRFALGLQDDRKLARAKLVAGVLSVVALVAMFVTSLSRSPNPVWTWIVGATALGLSVAIGAGLVGGRRRPGRRRRPSRR